MDMFINLWIHTLYRRYMRCLWSGVLDSSGVRVFVFCNTFFTFFIFLYMLSCRTSQMLNCLATALLGFCALSLTWLSNVGLLGLLAWLVYYWIGLLSWLHWWITGLELLDTPPSCHPIVCVHMYATPHNYYLTPEVQPGGDTLQLYRISFDDELCLQVFNFWGK